MSYNYFIFSYDVISDGILMCSFNADMQEVPFILITTGTHVALY